MIVQFYDIWLDVDVKNWINSYLGFLKDIILAVLLEIQQVAALYVKIANNVEYCLAVQATASKLTLGLTEWPMSEPDMSSPPNLPAVLSYYSLASAFVVPCY